MPKPKDIAKTTLDILEKGSYNNNAGETIDLRRPMKLAVEHTKLYKPADFERISDVANTPGEFETTYEVVNETALDVVRRLSTEQGASIMCLNFASARHPGGGFLTGAVAQEECIARASGLYPCLLKCKPYYDYHRKLDTCLYSDHMIYSPNVPIIKNEKGDLLAHPVYSAFITSPAVNAGAVKKNEPENIGEIVPTMKARAEKVLALSLHYKHNTLVLGAWGCGVFQNEPEDVAEIFHHALKGKYAGKFKKVVFAVFSNDEEMLAPFRKRFL